MFDMSINKIGSIEAIVLVCVVITNQILLNLPENIIKSCGSSAWLNIIYISIIAILFTMLLCKLFQVFINKDLLDICEYTGGKWLKFVIGISYIVLFVLISGTLLRYFCETIKLIYFHNTPVIILALVFLIAVAIANKIGFKAISNINLIIIPLVLISLLVIFFSTTNSFKFEQLFPIFGYGLNKTFFSGLTNIFAFGGIAFLYFLMPFLKKEKNFKKVSVIAIIISSIYLILSIICLLLVFPFISDTELTMSIYSLTRQIEYGKFLQRTDALFVLLWILSLLSYLSIVITFCLIIFKKISNITNPKAMTYCFTLLLFAIFLLARNITIAKFIQKNVYRYYEIILVFVISMLILIWGNLKYRLKHKNSKEGLNL